MIHCGNCHRVVPSGEKTKVLRTGLHLCGGCVSPKERHRLNPGKVRSCATCGVTGDRGWSALAGRFLCRECSPKGGTRAYLDLVLRKLKVDGMLDASGELTLLGEETAENPVKRTLYNANTLSWVAEENTKPSRPTVIEGASRHDVPSPLPQPLSVAAVRMPPRPPHHPAAHDDSDARPGVFSSRPEPLPDA